MPTPFLEFPFDGAELLRRKRALLRAACDFPTKISKRIAILGGSTTNELRDALELFLRQMGIAPEFYESEYARFYEDAVFGAPALDEFRPDVVIVYTTCQNILAWPTPSMPESATQHLLSREIQRFAEVWAAIGARHRCPVIQNNFEEPLFRPLGNLDFSHRTGRVRFVRELNEAFARAQDASSTLFVNDIHYLSAWFGLERWYERRHWHAYKLAMSLDATPSVAHQLSNIIGALFGLSRKAIALDLDNTLWGGVIGDDGVQGLRLGKETPEGEGHTELQQYLSVLHERGVLLSVCSKNDLNNAEAGFGHADSVLRREDILAFQANWDPKNENLEKIAQALNIGRDSLVFLDDNPAERDLVRRELPEVAVPEVGNEVSRFAIVLDKAGYFESVAVSDEDLQRAAQYRANDQRNDAVRGATDYDGYLRSLEMTAEIHSFQPIYLERITQLTNKTNQFNLTTRRYSSSEIHTIAASSGHVALYGRLVDRFGDNGLISVLVAAVRDGNADIELWLMSCRVLKRGMELAMFDTLVSALRDRNVTMVSGRYVPTAKNGMVQNLYRELGFRLVSELGSGETIWELDVSSGYEPKNRFIEVKQ